MTGEKRKQLSPQEKVYHDSRHGKERSRCRCDDNSAPGHEHKPLIGMLKAEQDLSFRESMLSLLKKPVLARQPVIIQQTTGTSPKFLLFG